MGNRRNSFGTIIAVGSTTAPRFGIRWWEGSRRKQRGGFSTRTAAAEALARVRVALGDGTLAERRRASIGFDEVAQQWLDLHSKPNLRSHTDNEERYRKHVAPFFRDCPLSVIDGTRLLELRARLQSQTITTQRRDTAGKLVHVERKMAPRTVNLVMALVRSILRFAVASGHIPSSPTDRLGRGKLMLPVERTKMAPPIETTAEVGRLLAAIRELGEESQRPWLFPLFALLVYTGLRRGEALGLRWADVDFGRCMVTVRRSYDGTTKSKKHRTVPLSTALSAILRSYRLTDPWKGELCFPNERGELFSRNSKLENALQGALRRVRLPRLRVHDLRHVFASHFVMAGGDIFTLQRILGHSTPQLTSDTYAHLSPSHLAREVERVSFPVPTTPASITLLAPEESGAA